MKVLVPNYSCLQNPWLGGYRPQIPVLSVLNWICWTPPNKIPTYAICLRDALTQDGKPIITHRRCGATGQLVLYDRRSFRFHKCSLTIKINYFIRLVLRVHDWKAFERQPLNSISPRSQNQREHNNGGRGYQIGHGYLEIASIPQVFLFFFATPIIVLKILLLFKGLSWT